MLENNCSNCLKKPGGPFNWLPHREELPVNSLLILAIHLPLADGGNSPCPEAVVAVDTGIADSLLTAHWGRFTYDCQSLPPNQAGSAPSRGICRPVVLAGLAPFRPAFCPLSRNCVWFVPWKIQHSPPAPACITLLWWGTLPAWKSWILDSHPSAKHSVCLCTGCLGLLVALGDSCLQRA